MNIEVKHRTYTNNVHGSKYKEMMENAGKNMYGNKFISCKNTYTKHDKAHHSSSKIHSFLVLGSMDIVCICPVFHFYVHLCTVHVFSFMNQKYNFIMY